MVGSKLGAAVVAAGMALASAGLLAVPAAAAPAKTVFIHRLTGATRYQTAVMIAEEKYPNGVPSGNVVLATGANYPDALVGSYLAGQLGAPIVLVPPSTSDPNFSSVAAALAALKAHTLYILGGTEAVGTDVQSDLSRYYTVVRIAGATRYDTMESADTRPGETPGAGMSGARTAIVATGTDFADALAAGPLAWNRHLPIITTDGSQTTLSAQAVDVIDALDITHFLVVGGPAAVNPDQVDELKRLGTVDRQFSGADRTQTAELLDAYTVADYKFETGSVILADGSNFPDALAAGPWGGDTQDVYLTETSDSLGTYATSGIKAVASDLTAINVVGVVEDNAVDQAASAAGATPVASDQSYNLSPAAAQTVSVRSTEFKASGLGSQPVDIALFDCFEVSPDSGEYTFAGTDPGATSNAAATGSVAHESMTLVDGKKTSGRQVNGVAPASGSVTFTVTNDGVPGDCVVPVVFAQTGTNALPLGTDDEPTVAFGAGGASTFTDTSAEPPTVTTKAAAAVTSTSATFEGSVDPNGNATTYHWRYGKAATDLADSTVTQSAGAGGSTVNVKVAQGGLAPDTTYYFALAATNAYGTTDGAVSDLTTSAAPTVTTNAAAAVTSTSATFEGSVDPNGSATTYHWRYGTTSSDLADSTVTQSAGAGRSAIDVAVAKGGLAPDTTYYFGLVATNAYGTTDGAVAHLTTIPAVPTVTSVSPDSGAAAGGSSVVVKGTNLTGATAVHFGSAAGTALKVASATELTVSAPAGTAGSTVVVTVTTAQGTSTAVGTPGGNEYTYAG